MKNTLFKKGLVVGIIVLFIGVSVIPSNANFLNVNITSNDELPLIPLTGGNTIYVDDDNTEGPWDGTIEYPYKTIKDALDNATDDDTIFVFSGYYFEGVRIKKQINLLGENKYTTFIEGENRHNAIILYDDYITISGFTINNTNDWANDCGIEIKNAFGTHTTHNTITNNIFTNHKTQAITIYQSNYNNVSNNIIIKSGGISFGSIENYNNVIINNTFIGSGLSIWGKPRNFLISNNNITQGSISVKGGYDNIVINNVIRNGGSIRLYDETYNNIVDNNLLISSGSIILEHTKNNEVKNNEFIDSKGIYIADGSIGHWSHIIENNNKNGKPIYYFISKEYSVIPSDSAQVILVECYDCLIRDLNISNVNYGIQIGFSTKIAVDSCNFIDNISYSIRVLSSTDCSIINNVIKNNFQTGIVISGSSSNIKIENNDIINNKQGIDFGVSTSDNTISYNNVENNDDYAIYVRGSGNTLRRNNIKNNVRGIYLDYSYDNNIYENNFIGNSKFFAFFEVDYTKQRDNIWNKNYYGFTYGFFPKLIWGFIKTKYYRDMYGEKIYFYRYGLNFDWSPVKNPYDITNLQGFDIK